MFTLSVSSWPSVVPVFTCESGSNWSDLVIWAVFLITAADVTLALNFNTLGVPTATVKPVAVSVPPVLVKSVLETKVKPAGSTSVASTLVAIDGPALLMVMVYSMVSPTFGVALLTVFVKLKSDCWPPISTPPVSSWPSVVPVFTCESISNWSEAETSALFKICPAWVTVALNFKTCTPPAVIEGILFEISVPVLFTKSAEETKVKPAGKTSFTFTFVAASGPSF